MEPFSWHFAFNILADMSSDAVALWRLKFCNCFISLYIYLLFLILLILSILIGERFGCSRVNTLWYWLFTMTAISLDSFALVPLDLWGAFIPETSSVLI